MEQTLFTKKELAKRWGISISTLDRRVKDGIITPTYITGPVKFNIEDILKVEGTDNSQMSPFERRRLEREIKSLKEENFELREKFAAIKKQLTNVVAEIMPILQDD